MGKPDNTQEQYAIELKALKQKYNALIKANKKLSASKVGEEKYHLLAQLSDQMIYEYNISSGEILWSGDIFTITGYTAEEFEKIDILNWEKLIHDDDREYALSLLNQAISKCADYKVEYRFKQKNGKYIFIEDNGTFKVNKEGKAVKMFGIMKDITERKLVEQALHKSEMQLKEAQHIAAIGSWELDLITNKLNCSDETYHIFEIDKQKFELTYNTFLNAIHPDDRILVKNAYESSVNSHTPYEVEHRILMGDGRLKYVYESCKTYYNIDGKPLRSIGIVQDITQRKHVEKALQESEHKYKSVVDNMIDGFYRADKDGNIVLVSPSVEKILGFSEKELIGKKVSQLYAREIEREDFLKEIKKTGKVENYIVEFKKKGNKNIFLEVNSRIVNNYGFIGIEGTFRDITHRKETEEKLLKRDNYLIALNKAESVLISSESENPFQQFVDILGEVSNASRTCIFINHKGENNELLMSQKVEYCAQGIKPEIDNPKLQNLSYDNFFERGREILQKGEIIFGRVDDFPDYEKEFLKSQNIKAILIIPIKIKNEFFGFIGFDNCISDREWDEAEKNLLQAAAGDLAQYIERNRVSDQLQKEYIRFQTVMDTIDSPIYVSDIQTNELLFTNKEFNNLFGNHIGEKCYSVIQKNQTEQCDFCKNNLLLDKNGNPNKPYIWEFHNPINNKWYQNSDQTIKWTDGRIAKIQIATDITHRKNVENALKESSEKYMALFQGVGDAILVHPKAKSGGFSNYIEVNDVACEMLGYSKEELLNMSVMDINDFTKTHKKEDIGKVLNSKKSFIFETEYIKKDGSQIPVEINANLFELNNKPIIISIVRDISLRKEAELKIQKSEARLRELNATKDKFFNIIAHDLKSPFNSIMGFSSLLVDQIKEKNYDDIEQYAQIILKSSRHAMNLLTNLMVWARSQTGRIEFNPEHINIVNLINEIANSFDDIATGKSISITRKLPTNIIVFADKAMISTVIRNLISNAIKFTHNGGMITISAEINQNKLKVSVNDNGVGISKSDLEKLFRIDENYSTLGTNNEQGTGLGLILCKDFIDKHNGNIWVESSIQKDTEKTVGSTFYFTIPA